MQPNPNIPKIFAWPTNQHKEVRARIAAHRAANEIIQGDGWRDGRGCAIGCSLDDYNPMEYACVFGLPLEVVYVIDYIHEALPRELSYDWPGRVAHALRPGSETTHMWSRFAVWLFREERPLNEGAVVDAVIRLYERRIAGDEPGTEEWGNAGAAANEVWLQGEDWAKAAASAAFKESNVSTFTALDLAWDAWSATNAATVWISPQSQADALIGILSANA